VRHAAENKRLIDMTVVSVKRSIRILISDKSAKCARIGAQLAYS